MKNLLFLFSITTAVAFTSCKKNFDCNCETTLTATYQGTTQTVKSNATTTVEAPNSKKAQGTCDTFRDETNKKAEDDAATGGQVGVNINANTVCSLNERK